MSKFGKYAIDSWPMSFKTTKTASGYQATVSLKQFKDKVWEAETEQKAVSAAKTEVNDTMQKGNNSHS